MYSLFVKRVLDILLSGISLIILFPVLIVLIILGAIFMHGNPFFVYPRAGKNGKIFNLIKFRSMAELKDINGNYLPDEIRLNKYGRLLRSTSLDELPEFNKNTLELMRGPLEDEKVTISRVNASLTYPCNFMMIASMNPCPCGYYGSKEKECTCNENSITKYMGKISGPLLDRIDIHIEVQEVKYDKLNSNIESESSEKIKQRVNKARKIQLERYKEYNIFSNSELTPKLIEKYCKLENKDKEILKNAFEKLGLSARAYSRILKVARTIADLDEKENIETKHLAEAIQYRNLDKKYWKN